MFRDIPEISENEMLETVLTQFEPLVPLFQCQNSVIFRLLMMDEWLKVNAEFSELYYDFFSDLESLLDEEDLCKDYELAINNFSLKPDTFKIFLQKSIYVLQFFYDNLCFKTWFRELQYDYLAFKAFYETDLGVQANSVLNRIRQISSVSKAKKIDKNLLKPLPNQASVINKILSVKKLLLVSIQVDDDKILFDHWLESAGKEYADYVLQYGTKFANLIRQEEAYSAYELVLHHTIIGGYKKLEIFLQTYPKIFEFFAETFSEENSVLEKMLTDYINFEENLKIEVQRDKKEISLLLLVEKLDKLMQIYPENFQLYYDSINAPNAEAAKIQFSYDGVSKKHRYEIEKYQPSIIRYLSHSESKQEATKLVKHRHSESAKAKMAEANLNLKQFHETKTKLKTLTNFFSKPSSEGSDLPITHLSKRPEQNY